jgi:GNAT superfamily N-acetyltransferase
MKMNALHQPSLGEITSAIESNLIAKFKYYPSRLGICDAKIGVVEYRDPDFHVDLINSQEKTSTFNIICNAQFLPTQLDEKIKMTEDFFSRDRLPVCWWIGPSTVPGILGEELAHRGWVYEGTDLGLAADLRSLPAQVRKSLEEDLNPKDISIEPVVDGVGMSDFASILASFFGKDEGIAIAHFYGEVAKRGFQASDPLQNFVAYFKGQPVATSSLFLSHGVAGFYDCLTIPEMRRKGIGMAMMRNRFRIVLDLGVPWVVLSSSHDSRGLYQRLGFKEYCQFSTYVKL